MKVYGFGSAFSNRKSASDVDILILHANSSIESCRSAIRLKKKLCEMMEELHLTMLSECEARHFRFLETSGAKLIAEVDHFFGDAECDEIISRLRSL